MSSTASNFNLFCDVSFRGWIGLENWQNFLDYIFPKNYTMALVLRYVVDSVDVNMRAKF